METIDTEAHIKQTAKKIFFSKGHLDAKTQEIADEAGVNRALLHYYFRTREKLFDSVLADAMEEAFHKVFSIMTSPISIEEKIEKLVAHLIDRTVEYPYMESFIISEMIKKPEAGKMLPKGEKHEQIKASFKKELEGYIKENQLPHITPEHFIVNMMSMCAYPAVSRPFLKHIFDMDDQQYDQFLLERKQVIPKVLLGKK